MTSCLRSKPFAGHGDAAAELLIGVIRVRREGV